MSDIDTSTEAVNALLEGVTEGPWIKPHGGGIHWQADSEDGSSSCWAIGAEAKRDPVALVVWPDWRESPEHDANARFVAASRELVPALLSERDAAIARAEAAEALLSEADEVLDRYADSQDGSYGQPEPNAALSMQSRIRAALSGGDA